MNQTFANMIDLARAGDYEAFANAYLVVFQDAKKDDAVRLAKRIQKSANGPKTQKKKGEEDDE